jgi:hypothetical protein
MVCYPGFWSRLVNKILFENTELNKTCVKSNFTEIWMDPKFLVVKYFYFRLPALLLWYIFLTGMVVSKTPFRFLFYQYFYRASFLF